MLNVVLMPTDVCHRHCKFCSMRSTGRGDVLPQETAAEIVRQIASFKSCDKRICITGGGEPLEYPPLPELFKMALATDISVLSLVTSGCKNEGERGYQTLKALSQIRDRRLRPTLSVNYLHPQVTIRRLQFTVPYLELMSPWLYMKCIVDLVREREKSARVLDRIATALLELGYCYGVDDLPEIERRKVDEKMLADLDKAWRHDFFSYKNPTLVVDSGKPGLVSRHSLEIGFQQLSADGRAADLLGLPPQYKESEKTAICASLKSPDKKYLAVRASGDIFPCTSEGWPDQMRLGNIANMTLREALSAKAAKLRWAEQNFRANPFDPESWDQCRRCYTE